MEDIEVELRLLRDFVSEYWANFSDFCEERGEDPQFIYEQIGGED